MTSDYCRVTVQWLFSKIFLIAWNVQKTLFDSQPTVAWPQPLSRDRSATFSKFSQIAWNAQKTLFDSRPTVAWPFSDFFQKKILIAWNVEKSLFDSRPTVAWPPTTVAWPFSDFFQNFRKSLETSRKRCLTVGRRSRDLRLLWRDRSVTFPRILLIAWNVQKTLFDSRPTVAWPPTTVAWPFSDFFKIFPNCLKRRKIVVWQSADSRVTSDHCRVTVQRLFSKFSQIARNVQKTLFDSRPTVAWPTTTVAWPFSDFFQKFSLLLETSKNRCLTVGRRSRDLNHCRVTVQRLFSNFPKSLETSKKRCLTVSRRSRDHRILSPDRSATFFKNFSKLLQTSKNVVWQSVDVRVTSVHCRVTQVTFFPCLFRTAFAYASVCCLSRSSSSYSYYWSHTIGFFDFARAHFSWNLKRDDANDNYISETITTIKTTYVPFRSVIIAIDESGNRTRLSLTVSEIFDRKHIALNGEHVISLLAVRIHSLGCCFYNVVQVSIPKFWCWRLHISETIWKTETSFAPFGSAIIALGQSENRTEISPTVSEIFDRKNSPERGYFFILLYYYYSSFRQKQGHVSPPTGMVRSWKFRHHIKARDRTKTISDFGGNIPTRWFPMREISSPL